MRICMLFALLLAACGSAVAAPRTSTAPHTPSPIPWIAATAIPTPIPTPAPPARPADVRDCAAADIAAIAYRGQGAGGWWVRGVVLGNRSGAPCLVSGPRAVAYLDANGAVIAQAGIESVSWFTPGWAVVTPSSIPVDDHVSHPGQARVMLWSYGDCEHRDLHAVAVTLAGSTGMVRVTVDPQPVGGRCDAPGQHLLVSSSPIGPTEPLSYPTTPSPLPLSFALEAPAVAFAGETMRYVVRVRNTSAHTFAWTGCPIYIESLGGREVTPTDVPGHAPKPPDKVSAGFWKELHLLNCDAAGVLPPGADAAFEMGIDVPRDAYGPDTLTWQMAGPFETGRATTPIELLPPRR
jgi:hypothetical protein